MQWCLLDISRPGTKKPASNFPLGNCDTRIRHKIVFVSIFANNLEYGKKKKEKNSEVNTEF